MWAGCASVGRTLCQVGWGCIRGQGDVSGEPGVRLWAGCPVRWAGCVSVGRVTYQVGRVCICGQGILSGGPGVHPWAMYHVRWAGDVFLGRIGGCRAYVDGEAGCWWSSVICSMKVFNCWDGSSR